MPRLPYLRRTGDVLTLAEVAHLLTRAAAGETLPCLPVKTADGWRLCPYAALSAAQIEAHTQRLQAIAAVLSDAAPALLGLRA